VLFPSRDPAPKFQPDGCSLTSHDIFKLLSPLTFPLHKHRCQGKKPSCYIVRPPQSMAQSRPIFELDTHRGRLHNDAASEYLDSQHDVLSMSQGFSGNDVQTGQALLQQCDDEHANANGTDEEKSDSHLSTWAAKNLTRKPTTCRRATAPSAIGQAALDICITAASMYFVAFALMATSQNGKSAASTTAKHLLDAARLVSYANA
jgi:hypothetical protein